MKSYIIYIMFAFSAISKGSEYLNVIIPEVNAEERSVSDVVQEASAFVRKASDPAWGYVGVAIVPGSLAQRKVTMHLKGVPFVQLLSIISESSGCRVSVEGGSILIYQDNALVSELLTLKIDDKVRLALGLNGELTEDSLISAFKVFGVNHLQYHKVGENNTVRVIIPKISADLIRAFILLNAHGFQVKK